MLAALGDGKLFSVQCEVILHFAGAAGPGDGAEFRATTTYCQIDPKERLVAIAFAQHFPYNEHNLFAQWATAYYQALK